MKIILAGHQESKKIILATSYLLKKYLPKNYFDIYFLNYGNFDKKLEIGTYVSLDQKQFGGSDSWCKYLKDYLSKINDKFIIFGLDDYFLSKKINLKATLDMLSFLKKHDNVIGAKLGITPSQRHWDYNVKKGTHIYIMKNSAVYLATTQFTIWKRSCLVEVLSCYKKIKRLFPYRKINNPWEFENNGTEYVQKKLYRVIGSKKMPWKYCEASALSSRHPNRINVFALSHQDISELINKKYFQKKDLILGQWIGTVKKYSKLNKKEYLSSLEHCPEQIIDTYKLYYKLMMSKSVE
jgi:hypothetical protein